MADLLRRLLPIVRDAVVVVLVTVAVWWGSGWLLSAVLEPTATRPHGVVHAHTGERIWLTGLATTLAFAMLGARRERHWLHSIAVGALLCASVGAWIALEPMRTGGHGPPLDLRVLLVGFFAVTTLVGLVLASVLRWIRHGGG